MSLLDKHHFMLDFETFSTQRDAILCTVGCCKFDIKTGDILNTYYKKIDGSPNAGHISRDTLAWWLSPERDPRARAELIPDNDSIDIVEMIITLTQFINKLTKMESTRMWCTNNFDTMLFEYQMDKQLNNETNLSELMALCTPWHFREIRDIRTLLEMAKEHDPTFDKKQIMESHKDLIPHQSCYGLFSLRSKSL